MMLRKAAMRSSRMVMRQSTALRQNSQPKQTLRSSLASSNVRRAADRSYHSDAPACYGGNPLPPNQFKPAEEIMLDITALLVVFAFCYTPSQMTDEEEDTSPRKITEPHQELSTATRSKAASSISLPQGHDDAPVVDASETGSTRDDTSKASSDEEG